MPGDPDALTACAEILRRRAASAGTAAEGLRALDTGAWTGAAGERFRERFGYEPGRWFTAADAMQAGAGALNDFAATLRWAQGQAVEAVRLWDHGQAATLQAQPALAEIDPGAAARASAQDILRSARAQVRSAAAAAAGTLRSKASAAPEKSSWLDSVGDALHDTGAGIVNGVASFGNAVLHNPGSAAAAAAGIGLAVVSAGGGGVGLALDATGVGAVAGVPLNALAVAGVVAGASITTAAMADLAARSGGDARVAPVEKSARSDAVAADSTADTPAGVQPGWSSRPADNGKGTVFQRPGAAGNADMVRVMEPTPRYPHGYVRYYNEHGQPVGLDGKPGSRADTHLPIGPDGSWPVPRGW